MCFAKAFAIVMAMDTFHSFFKRLSKDERKAFAESAGTSVAYLWQIIYGQRRCSEALAIEISKASGGVVRFDALCPDVDWEYVRRSLQSIAKSKPNIVEQVETVDDVQPPTGGKTTRKRKK